MVAIVKVHALGIAPAHAVRAVVIAVHANWDTTDPNVARVVLAIAKEVAHKLMAYVMLVQLATMGTNAHFPVTMVATGFAYKAMVTAYVIKVSMVTNVTKFVLVDVMDATKLMDYAHLARTVTMEQLVGTAVVLTVTIMISLHFHFHSMVSL